MHTHKKLYSKIYDFDNLFLAYQKARKGKTRRAYVIEFERNLEKNLLDLQFELKAQIYSPKPLETFILHDPKTRKISKADFRDRIIHHALINIIGPIFEKSFIYDSCANQKGKGNLFAIKRFAKFMRKVSRNGTQNSLIFPSHVKGYCLKADIKHYFQEVNHEILLQIIQKKISDKNVIWLIKQIISGGGEQQRGMPLGNLTSQFFANVYLNKFDYFIKHELKAKFYIRYVDDFVILYNSKEQLEKWQEEINKFLKEKLKLELHQQKSRIILLSKGIDFVGFRIFFYFKLLRKRNIKKMFSKILNYSKGEITKENILESFQGWQAYAKWANSYRTRKEGVMKILISKHIKTHLSFFAHGEKRTILSNRSFGNSWYNRRNGKHLQFCKNIRQTGESI